VANGGRPPRMGLPFCSPRTYGEGAGGARYKYQPPRCFLADRLLQPDEERSQAGHRRRNKTRPRHRHRPRKPARSLELSPSPTRSGGAVRERWFVYRRFSPSSFSFRTNSSFFPIGTKATAFEPYWDSTPSSI
jgi:hypothetical protein